MRAALPKLVLRAHERFRDVRRPPARLDPRRAGRGAARADVRARRPAARVPRSLFRREAGRPRRAGGGRGDGRGVRRRRRPRPIRRGRRRGDAGVGERPDRRRPPARRPRAGPAGGGRVGRGAGPAGGEAGGRRRGVPHGRLAGGEYAGAGRRRGDRRPAGDPEDRPRRVRRQGAGPAGGRRRLGRRLGFVRSRAVRFGIARRFRAGAFHRRRPVGGRRSAGPWAVRERPRRRRAGPHAAPGPHRPGRHRGRRADRGGAGGIVGRRRTADGRAVPHDRRRPVGQ